MSDSFGLNEEFEKVDAIQDQDENVTSTSVTEDIDMAEEDRYAGTAAPNDVDLLGDFLGGGASSEAAASDPLLSFGTPIQESVNESAPTEQTVTTETVRGSTPTSQAEGAMGIPGMKALCCWMKTVDPRDDIKDMEEPVPSDTGVTSPGVTAELPSQPRVSGVLDLIYWRDLKKTGVVFGSMMFIFLSLTFFTILSVLAYLSLAVLTVTLSFRVYKNVMQAVQKTSDGHPFKKLLDLDIALQGDVVQNAADKIATNVNNCSCELRRLFLIEDYVDSLKFGLLLWLLTYVGSWFNGMTLVILAVVCIFTLPKVYETYQGPIDQNVNLVRGQLNNILKQVSSKIPFPKKKAKTQ